MPIHCGFEYIWTHIVTDYLRERGVFFAVDDFVDDLLRAGATANTAAAASCACCFCCISSSVRAYSSFTLWRCSRSNSSVFNNSSRSAFSVLRISTHCVSDLARKTHGPKFIIILDKTQECKHLLHGSLQVMAATPSGILQLLDLPE